MADRDGKDGRRHDCSALPMQAQRHGKQPAHRGVEPVKSAEPSERQPWPNFIHDGTMGRNAGRAQVSRLRNSHVLAVHSDANFASKGMVAKPQCCTNYGFPALALDPPKAAWLRDSSTSRTSNRHLRAAPGAGGVGRAIA